MSLPVVTALTQRERLWPAVLASVAVHVALFTVALRAGSAPEIDLEQTPIQAKLVRLGEKKPEHLLPQKETPPPPAPASPAPEVAAPPTPAPPEPSRPTAAPTPARATVPRPPARGPASAAGTNLVDNILNQQQQRVQRERWGDQDGSPFGDADEGDKADPYLTQLTAAVQANYHLPSTISERERLYLEAVVIVWIEPDGGIRQWRIAKPSGNAAFDAALERAVRATRAPPPPADRRELFRRTGAQITFNVHH